MVCSLAVVEPVVPDLICEVAAEEASHLFGSRFPAVEESAGGKVVELAFHLELPVGDDDLVWMVRQVAEVLEDVRCGDVSQLGRYVQSVVLLSF